MNSNVDQEIDSKFLCPICQLVLTQPYTLTNCTHSYCTQCIFGLIEHADKKKLQCPLCKVNFTSRSLKANKKLEEEMKTVFKTCDCATSVSLYEWNEHTSSCKVNKDNLERSLKKIKTSGKTDIKKVGVNRSTFTCPLCKMTNLEREALVKHVKQNHRDDTAVCPICLCQPWGDPNYVTHLYGHLIKRHNFDYDTTVDYNENEDEVLQRVLRESLKDVGK